MQASARLSSSAASKRVIAGVSSTIVRSCQRTWRGKSHAAAPLSAQEASKGPKRIGKKERRVKIEKFVEEYKASNDGKFPSMKIVREHVGGSHYTVREIVQELEYNQTKLQLNKSEEAQQPGTAEFSDHLKPEDDNGKSLSSSGSFSGDRDTDDLHLSQEVAATSHDTIEKVVVQTETLRSEELEITSGSSCRTGEAEAVKQDLIAADNLQSANESIVPCQTESGNIKNEDSISLGLDNKSDPCDQGLGEGKADKLELNGRESFKNASEPIVSGQIEGDKMIKENAPDREENPELEPKTGLLGSLKSFAFGIRNFWRKL
uniref:AT3G52170-like helix-turn-helix domain-containing protein n=1 Tax=Leersia perrieri TaxID=77586 RepID=A0A0D9VIR0_9ORYZ